MSAAYPRVTTILREVGLDPDYSMVDPAVMEAAQARGTAVHEAIEAHHYGYLDEDALDPVVKPYLGGYRAFLKDSGFEPIATEFEVVHPQWEYLGHPDQMGWLLGKRAIVDFKTPESVNLKAAGFQLAAYRMAYNAMHPKEPVEITAVLQLKRDGTFRFHNDVGNGESEQVFLAALIVYRARTRKEPL